MYKIFNVLTVRLGGIRPATTLDSIFFSFVCVCVVQLPVSYLFLLVDHRIIKIRPIFSHSPTSCQSTPPIHSQKTIKYAKMKERNKNRRGEEEKIKRVSLQAFDAEKKEKSIFNCRRTWLSMVNAPISHFPLLGKRKSRLLSKQSILTIH